MTRRPIKSTIHGFGAGVNLPLAIYDAAHGHWLLLVLSLAAMALLLNVALGETPR